MSEKKKMSNKLFMAILIPIIVIVVASLIVANVIAQNWSTLISRFFNHDTYTIVKIDENEEVNDIYYASDFETETALNEHNGQVARDIEAEGMVLLENDGGLPLTTSASDKAKVSLFSVSSVDMVYGGTGSGSIDTSTAPTLKDALEGVNLEVNQTLWDFYKNKNDDEGYERSSPNWRGGQFAINEVPWADVQSAAGSTFSEYNDAAIVVIARSGGEGSDLTAVNFGETENVEGNSGSYLELSTEEADMLNAVNAAFDNVIVLINANNALELGWLDDYENIKAALWIGGVGQTGLYAVADALVGEVVPSGRLVDTYAYDANSSPAAQNAGANFWISNSPSSASYANEADQYIVYAEGIYVGYRYYETRYEDTVLGTTNVGEYDYAETVQYPFGYGLSYTTFSYSDFTVTPEDDKFVVSVKVTNSGSTFAGKEVVQIYMQSPYTEYDKTNGVEKASVELVGFAKTDALAPGADETVTIEIDKEELRAYDANNAETYIVDDGDYYFAVGTDAHDALNNILAAKGYDTSDGMTENGDAAFAYRWHNDRFDDTTYSVDQDTGTEITNQFETADLTNWSDGNGFEYLTRDDWTGTFPTAFCNSTNEKGEHYKSFSQDMIDSLAPQYTEDKDSFEMPTTSAAVTDGLNLATLIGLDYDSDAWYDFLDNLTASDMMDMIRMGGYGTPENQALNMPATTAKDGPAGISATLIGGSSGMAYPTEVVVASTWNVELANEMGVAVGNDAMYANVQAWYAPAMNTHRTPYSGRNFEYYSEDGFLGGRIGASVVAGAQSKSLVCYIKHFALNDTEGVIDATNDIMGSKDGISTFATEQAIREIYLTPFEFAVKDGGATGVMNAFNRIGTTWCGHHSNLQQNVLRGEWGFIGCIITDNAGLEAYMDIKAGLQAGTDLWMNSSESRYIIDGYASDPQIMTYVRNASHNILYSVANSVAMNGLSSNSRVVSIIPLWNVWLIWLDIVVGLICAAGIVWIVVRCKRHPELW